MDKQLTRLAGSPGCFICDNNGSNPRSLALKLYWDEAGQTLEIPFQPDATWCSFENVVHGGLIASILDEAMGHAVKMTLGEWAFTADFKVRYKKMLTPGQAYTARAKVLENKGRVITASAELLDETGKAAAQAEGAFLPGKRGGPLF